MHNKWKSTQIVPGGRGRPSNLTLNKANEGVKNHSRSERTGDISAFNLSDMKNVFELKKREQAKKDGLDSEGVKCNVSDQTAKATMVAVAMDANDSSFTTKKLLKKTPRRFQAENSIMGGYAYAATVLSTHFIEGKRPANHW